MQLQLVLDDVLVCRLVVVFVVFDVVVVIVVVAVAAPVIFNAHFPCLTAFIVCQLKIYLITLLHTVFILFGFSFSSFFFFLVFGFVIKVVALMAAKVGSV